MRGSGDLVSTNLKYCIFPGFFFNKLVRQATEYIIPLNIAFSRVLFLTFDEIFDKLFFPVAERAILFDE